MAQSITFFAIMLVTGCSGHGAVVHPPPRNAVERGIAPWNNGVPYPIPFAGDGKETTVAWCPVGPWGKEGNSTQERPSGKLGQACYWFSNGCSIGCDACDGNTRGPIPDTHMACRNRKGGCQDCKGMGPTFSPSCQRKMDTCGKGAKATICDASLRTLNIEAPCGGETDWYYYSPWRAPGHSPVFDSCGMAGGRRPEGGGFGAQFHDTQYAKQGDLGSQVLKPVDAVTWQAGQPAEVSWTILANHGGGYQWRLCPKSANLTEECFFKTPLNFTGPQKFRWSGPSGVYKTHEFNGTYVSEGTLPPGSTWAMNPIPSIESGTPSFVPRCEENPKCDEANDDPTHCLCSGPWSPAHGTLEIVDQVVIPATLPAGEYVLGWRWDCEESNQIWASCSDVTIRAAAGG